MELLLTPQNATSRSEKTPYVCQERWDGKPFLTYAHRKGKTKTISPVLRHEFGSLGPYDAYSEILYPTPQEEQQPFYQTWFFFGLLAEMLCLNSNESGERLVDEATAGRELQSLYDNLTVLEDGRRYIKVEERIMLSWGSQMMGRLREAKVNLISHFAHLASCLHWTSSMIGLVRCELDDSIRFSIAALGEYFSSGMSLFMVSSGMNFPFETRARVAGTPWSRLYLRPDGPVEKLMLDKGWCKSEIEKIRQQYTSLNATHYLSRLEKPLPRRDHGNCAIDRCTAFELDLKDYRPSHIDKDCKCEFKGVDMREVIRILKTTDKFPVLRMELADDNETKVGISVEPYQPGVPFVAVSHVWADGLGNPHANTLPWCQIKRVAQMVEKVFEIELLAMFMQAASSNTQPPRLFDPEPYRFWIDPLLCPVEKEMDGIPLSDMREGKKISLQKISDVYRSATHVVVLDSSISVYNAETMHPAEVLLRIVGSSAWMRRLWTLQEAALANSLLFQFADGLVGAVGLLSQILNSWVFQDPRYLRIGQEVQLELERLASFFQITDSQYRSEWFADSLVHLQVALHFRTLTVASDEAICIANLLSLDVSHILEVDDAQERMARVWSLIASARMEKGLGLPARLVFFEDDTLDLPGWRWAPRTLMSASATGSSMDMDSRLVRFDMNGKERFKLGYIVLTARDSDTNARPTIPPSLGFKIQFPGFMLKPRPRCADLPLHPWEGITAPHEDHIIIRNQKTGKFMRVMDMHRVMKFDKEKTSHKDKMAYNRSVGRVLCDAVDTSRCALICNPGLVISESTVSLMVLIEEANPEQPGALMVRKHRRVNLAELDPAAQLASEHLESLADSSAQDQSTRDLVAIKDQESAEYKSAQTKARSRMKEMTAEAWHNKPEFAEAARQSQSHLSDLDTFEWAYIPIYHSHVTDAEELPDDQVWIVG